MKPNITRAMLLTTACLLASGEVMSATHLPSGNVTWIENGWFGEGMAFGHTTTTTGCPTASEYAISKDHPSYKELVSILIAAKTSGKRVSIVAEQGSCLFGGRTQVFALRLVD